MGLNKKTVLYRMFNYNIKKRELEMNNVTKCVAL